MQKIIYLLILLTFLVSIPCFAQEGVKPSSLSPSEGCFKYKKDSLNHWEMVHRIKSNINHLQTVPFISNAGFQFDVGPAQFQLTIPFR